MLAKSNLEEQCLTILEENGGQIADEARTILLKEKSLRGLRGPLTHIAENWRDPSTPSLVILSCEAVGGKADEPTRKVALALTLLSLSFTVWDDLLDAHFYKRFAPTVVGKFGGTAALIVGGLASAKTFSILNLMEKDRKKNKIITELVWNYLKKVAEAEAANLKLRKRSDAKPENKLDVINTHAVSLETLMKVGAVMGNGTQDEVEHLGNYGRYLYTILELQKDFKASINLTLELAERIKNGSFTYTLLWAKNRSEEIIEYLTTCPDTIKPTDIRKIVDAILETNATEHTIRLLEKMTQKGDKELSKLQTNNATKSLEFFLQAQLKIFLETLSNLQF
jgi:geranylgeranyl pyrophosphate synthase